MPDQEWRTVKSDNDLRWVDVVPTKTRHSLGSLDCWCAPQHEVVDGLIIIKHFIRPHSWVSGPEKERMFGFSQDFEYDEDGIAKHLDDVPSCAMVCENCGGMRLDGDIEHIDGDLCVGPALQGLDFINPGSEFTGENNG